MFWTYWVYPFAGVNGQALGCAQPRRGRLHVEARRLEDNSAKRPLDTQILQETIGFASPTSAAPARAALAAGKRLPPDMAGCPRSRCTPLARSHGRRRTVALTPRSPSRRRRGPPGFARDFCAPRAPFPRPVPSRLAHARLPPAVLACAALTPRKAPTARDKPLPPCLLAVLPQPPSSPQTVPPSLPRRNRSPEFAEPPPSSLTRPAFSLPHHPLPLSDHTPTRFRHHSRRRSSPEKLELSLAPLLLRLNRGHQQLRRAALVLIDPFPDLLRPRRRRSPLAGVAEPPPSSPSTFPAIPARHSPRPETPARRRRTNADELGDLPAHHNNSSSAPIPLERCTTTLEQGCPWRSRLSELEGNVHPRSGDFRHVRAQPSSRGTSTLEQVISVTLEPSQARGGRSPGVFRLVEGADYSSLADGVYELVPAAEEIAQESEVNMVHVDPSPEQEYRFEPEGKPRSIT
nr:unnamed protein product [Digitaria exilis]